MAKTPEEIFHNTSNEVLLRTFAQLTHKMHEADGPVEELHLRLLRNHVQDEILERMK